MESPQRQSADQSTTILAVVVFAVIISVAIVLNLPTVAHGGSSSQSRVLSNIKQISTGTIIYLADYDDKYMPVQDQATYQQLIDPYIKNPDLFTFGTDKHQVNVVFNTHLSGVVSIDIPHPESTIHLHTPYAPGQNDAVTKHIAAYADGHAKPIPAADWPTKRESLDWLFPREAQDFYPVK